MSADVVLVSEIVDGIATVTLNRPDKKNALSIAVREAMSDALAQLATDEALRVVVITGAGDAFSAGFDLGEFAIDTPGFQDRLWHSSDRFHRAVLRFPLPTIAAVNGAALAGGFDLALLCDIRIATSRARFAHPEQTFGDVVFSPLEDLAGSAVARDLAFTGRAIDAEEALRLGIVSVVVDPSDLQETVAEWAGRVARAPRHLLMRTKAKALARAAIDPDTRTLDL